VPRHIAQLSFDVAHAFTCVALPVHVALRRGAASARIVAGPAC
jgi:hypothetical protein